MPSNGQFRPNASSHSIALKRLETEHSTSYATVCKWMELAFKANELLAILRRVLELLEIVPRSRTGRTSVNWRTMSSVKVAIIEFIWPTKNIHIFFVNNWVRGRPTINSLRGCSAAENCLDRNTRENEIYFSLPLVNGNNSFRAAVSRPSIARPSHWRDTRSAVGTLHSSKMKEKFHLNSLKKKRNWNCSSK